MSDIYPDVIPMVAYEDCPAAMDWLARAFGFRERTRIVDDSGRLAHGEMEVGAGLVMLATPGPDYQSPNHHRQTCATSASWLSVPFIVDGALVYVDDVLAHCAQARSAGATLLSEVESDEHGTRYRVEDLEGHRWMFMQR